MPGRWFDLALRVIGAALWGGCAIAASRLSSSVRAGAPHPATVIELLLALATFICLTGGGALLFVGDHLFDRVEISERWRSQR